MPARSAWCPHCGDGRPARIMQEHDQGVYPVSAIWIVGTIFLVPLSACGGCLAIVFTQQNSPPSNEIFLSKTLNFALAVEVISVLIGIILLTYNFIKGRQ